MTTTRPTSSTSTSSSSPSADPDFASQPPQNHLSDPLFKTLAQAAAFVLLAAGLSGAVPTAAAQSSSAQSASARSNSEQWQENFDEQMARQLRQEPSLRADLMEVVIDQATKKKDLRLSKTAGALLEVVEEDSEKPRRVLAVQALSVIGAQHLGEKQYRQTIDRLYALSEEELSAEVQIAVADVITQYQNS